MAEPLRHPGAPTGPRIALQPCRAEHRKLTLRSGRTLAQALAEALDGIDSAWIDLSDVSGDLVFVLPDHAPDAQHAAWYSPEYRLTQGRIERAGMIWGQRDLQGFAHIHGLWSGTMGHLLAGSTRLDCDHMIDVTVLSGAMFTAQDDTETGFTLFQPAETAMVDHPNAALLRLAPNVDLSQGVADAVATLGWSDARIKGIGSLNAPLFEDGTVLDSHATEFLIRDGVVQDGQAQITLDIVGIGGTLAHGTVAQGRAPVCVTAELILLRA